MYKPLLIFEVIVIILQGRHVHYCLFQIWTLENNRLKICLNDLANLTRVDLDLKCL